MEKANQRTTGPPRPAREIWLDPLVYEALKSEPPCQTQVPVDLEGRASVSPDYEDTCSFISSMECLCFGVSSSSLSVRIQQRTWDLYNVSIIH